MLQHSLRSAGRAAIALSLLASPTLHAEEEDGIKVGGAVRVQYSVEDYDPDNRERGGDFDFDTFRINLDGTVGEITLSAEWRYYQYMQVIHHAWVGYDFNEHWQGQLGITRVPFGNQPYNSHSYFFDTTYYVGLEDDYDMGAVLHGQLGALNLQLGFFKNDEQGGVDGYVSNRSERYSYDVVGVRQGGEGTFDAPTAGIAEGNTLAGRLAWKATAGDLSADLGLSALGGRLYDATDDVGKTLAYAAHANVDLRRWNLMLQATRYDYELDAGGDALVVGAYAFFDTIPASATLYTANLAYALPVKLGPISQLTFYNDYSLMTAKAGGLDDTFMNVLGVSIAAGGLFTYVDLVTAENQPFIGGSLGADGGTQTRLNVNVGYYF